MFKQTKRINNKDYSYLEHSFRIGRKIRKVSFYISKEERKNVKQFAIKNTKAIEKIAGLIEDYTKKNKNFSDFFGYGEQIKRIESKKVEFQVLFRLISEKSKKEIVGEFLRTFLVNSMAMEGGTISYEVAKAIEQKKKIRMEGISELDIPLYNQLKEAYFNLNRIKLRYPKQIKDLHFQIYKGIYPFAGKFRKEEATFGNVEEMAVTSKPENITKDYAAALRRYYSTKTKVYDFERVVEFHKDYQAVHGFEDGNSRLGRLIMASQLMKLGYPPMIIRGSQSRGYRQSLVRAINKRDDTSLIKFFYNAYNRTFDRFWLPILQENLNLKNQISKKNFTYHEFILT